MNEELKEIITGLIFSGLLILGAIYFFGENNDPDLSSDFEEREGQYYDGDGNGHPLWR